VTGGGAFNYHLHTTAVHVAKQYFSVPAMSAWNSIIDFLFKSIMKNQLSAMEKSFISLNLMFYFGSFWLSAVWFAVACSFMTHPHN